MQQCRPQEGGRVGGGGGGGGRCCVSQRPLVGGLRIVFVRVFWRRAMLATRPINLAEDGIRCDVRRNSAHITLPLQQAAVA